MATAGGGGGGGRIYVRQTSGRPSGLFEELGDRTICGPADETRLCIFERGPGGKLERAEDRCVPKTETGDDMARHSAKCNKMKHTWRTERTACVAELRAQEQAAAQAQPPAQQAHAPAPAATQQGAPVQAAQQQHAGQQLGQQQQGQQHSLNAQHQLGQQQAAAQQQAQAEQAPVLLA